MWRASLSTKVERPAVKKIEDVENMFLRELCVCGWVVTVSRKPLIDFSKSVAKKDRRC